MADRVVVRRGLRGHRRSSGVSRLGWLGMVAAGAALLTLAGSLAGPFGRLRERAADRVCASNLRLLAYALLAYAQDQGGCLPPGPVWGEAIFPRVGIEKAYGCPAAPDLGRRAYAYYDRLADFPLSELSDPARQPMVYDSDRGIWNARDSQPEPTPTGRHHGGNLIAFADGSVRWVAARTRFPEPQLKPAPPSLPPHRDMSETVPVLLYSSRSMGAGFEYPADWALTDRGTKVTIVSRDSSTSIRLEVSQGGAVAAEVETRTGTQFRYNVPAFGAVDAVPGRVFETVNPGAHRVELVCSYGRRTYRLTVSTPEERWPEVRDIAWSVVESFTLSP